MAGAWGDINGRGLEAFGGDFQSMFAMAREFTADAANASVPDWLIDKVNPAFLADIGVVFGTPAPNSVVVTVKDIDGLTVCTETFSASDRIIITDRPSVIGGCTVSISGNTINSAMAKVILNFANNLR